MLSPAGFVDEEYLQVFKVHTTFGIVRVQPSEPDETGAILYELTGAARGTVHVTASHDPRQWDRFDAVRVSLGSANDTFSETAEPLPRIRGRAYTGKVVHLPARGHEPAEWATQWVSGPEGRSAGPRTAEGISAVMVAAGEHYRGRADLLTLRQRARRQETPKLVQWLRDIIASNTAEEASLNANAARHRADAAMCTAMWWTAARWLLVTPDPVLLLLLAGGRDTIADRACIGPALAQVSADIALDVHRVGDRYRRELVGLAPRSRSGVAAPC
ncbi:hypothetical protein ABT127_39125 [Streptomyces sp. NPDC001904]|uniref:hypothetical protein n=1 Tax=Streptomyces sp. NPDC001904 TaxID=3154531 RepID=UPI0033329867